MNFKSLFWICEKYFEQIHPNIYDDNEEKINADELKEKDIIDDINNDYHNLCSCVEQIIAFINSKIIKTD